MSESTQSQPMINGRYLPKIVPLLIAGIILLSISLWHLFLSDSKHGSSPQPTPTATPKPTTSITPQPTFTPNQTAPSNEPTISPIMTQTPIPTVTPTAGPSPTPTATTVLPEITWGNRTIKQVIFTFDAGSGNTSIDSILATLSQFKVEGSFFLTGAWAATYPSDVRRIALGGHAIYNHTYTHPHLTQITDTQIIDELSRTDKLITSLVGFDSKPFFRAPYGERNGHVLAVAASQDYQSVYWTIDAWDWKEGITASEVKARVIDNLQPGTIYLMHVGDPITGQVLAEIFSQIRNQGYSINSLSKGIR